MAHRKATSVLEARGAFVKDPQRRREPEPENANPLGAPPDYLTPEQARAWLDVATTCAPGVLTESERLLVEMLSVVIAEFRDPTTKTNTAVMGKIESMLGRLGMTPADRQRVAVPRVKDASEFDDL